jgi:short-subunit dehydrogenase
VKVVVADLTEAGACARVMAEATSAFGSVDVLVNNAGVGEYGRFVEKDLAVQERMMQLNMAALVHLTHSALPAMLSRRRGWIMNVASALGFQPAPYMAVYGATKAFVLGFSMSLWEEVRQAGVVVTCVCPGPVKTEFLDRGGCETRKQEFTRFAVTADRVAEASYRALIRKKPFCVPDRLNRLSVFLQRFVPLKTVAKLSGRVLGPR